MDAFFHMGGYAIYVWPSYAAAALILGLLTTFSLRQLRDSMVQLDKLEERMKTGDGRRRRPPADQ